MDNHKPHPQFVRGIQAGLRYWQVETQDESDAAIRRLDAERHNLYRLVQYGRAVPDLWPDTAVLARNAFYLVERRGYWSEWIPVLEQAVTQWVQDDLRLKGQLLNQLGYFYCANRQLTAAVTAHAQAGQIARELANTDLLNHAWFYLCADYRHLRQYDQAEQYGILALAGFEQADNNKWQACAHNELGLLAYHRGDLVRARQRLETAVALHRQSGGVTDLLRTLNNLIGVARAEKNYDLALAYYREAASYFDVSSSEFDRTVFETALGGTLFELGRYAEAEAAFRRANTPYLQHSQHIHQRALVWQCLGNVLLKQNHLDESESCLQESARLWAAASDDMLLANTLGTLGELYMAKREAQTAVAYFDQALFHLDKFPDDATAVRLKGEFSVLKALLYQP
ncbi:MAG TPA: tetratricopeptide repeat protein [Chloroflexota bacterium]|nr:tetratricopeptide repeat protein [Chloroflexota bacterium]